MTTERALTSVEIVEECIAQFRNARGSVVMAMPLLYKISEENLWEARYSSLGEFLDECGISRSQASRLIAVYARFQGVSQLNSVDPEKLYLSLKLDGSPEEQFAKAATLSRAELKEQDVFEKTGKEHDCEFYCKTCHRKA